MTSSAAPTLKTISHWLLLHKLFTALDSLCDILDRATDGNRELYLLGDINIDWLSETCPLK